MVVLILSSLVTEHFQRKQTSTEKTYLNHSQRQGGLITKRIEGVSDCITCLFLHDILHLHRIPTLSRLFMCLSWLFSKWRWGQVASKAFEVMGSDGDYAVSHCLHAREELSHQGELAGPSQAKH